MARRWAAALALVLASGCMEFDPVGPGEESYAVLFLHSLNPGPGTAPDTLSVSGFVTHVRGGSFTDDTLRIGDRAIVPAVHPGGSRGYSDTLLFSPGTLAQPRTVTLPQPAGQPLVLQEFLFRSAARRGPETLTVRLGHDVVLPVEPGALTGAAAEPPEERWSVSLLRGQKSSEIAATSPLPHDIVIPASLVPADTASAMDVVVRSFKSLRASGDGTVYVDVQARLRWRVLIAP
jgi:hypothetical protein